jgi:hypothetical protein
MNKIAYFDNRFDLLRHLPKGGVVAEIGVLKGNFAQYIWDVVQPQEFHLVDIWNNTQNYTETRNRFRHLKEVTIHKADSALTANEFPDEYFDWVYIDACHKYDFILADIQAWAPKVKTWLMGHDFQSEEPYGSGVMRAVIETIQTREWEMIGITEFDDYDTDFGYPLGGRWLSWALGRT